MAQSECHTSLLYEELAEVANMSPSGLYHHFRAITGGTPLTFDLLFVSLTTMSRLKVVMTHRGKTLVVSGFEDRDSFAESGNNADAR